MSGGISDGVFGGVISTPVKFAAMKSEMRPASIYTSPSSTGSRSGSVKPSWSAIRSRRRCCNSTHSTEVTL